MHKIFLLILLVKETYPIYIGEDPEIFGLSVNTTKGDSKTLGFLGMSEIDYKYY